MDSKALTDLGLEELEVNSSPASTDYVVVVNPNNKTPKLSLVSAMPQAGGATATAAEISTLDNIWDSITLTSETGASGSVAVQVVFNDAAGVAMATPVSGTFYLSEVATGLTMDAADTGIAVLTNGGLFELDAAHKAWMFVTDATGKLGFTITAAADSYWACFQKPNGSLEIVGPLISD